MHHLHDHERGFSLVELSTVLVVIGLVLAFTIPGYLRFSQDQQLRGTTQSLVAQIQLTRARAMATGTTQTVNFDNATTPHRIVVLGSGASRTWSLPKGITFVQGNTASFDLTSDGRASGSRTIVIQNQQGRRDTLSVQMSGLTLVL